MQYLNYCYFDVMRFLLFVLKFRKFKTIFSISHTGNTGVLNFKTWASGELTAVVISLHQWQPSGIVVHYVPSEVAPTKALYIFCPLQGYGLFLKFIPVEKNSGWCLTTVFPPRLLSSVKMGTNIC